MSHVPFPLPLSALCIPTPWFTKERECSLVYPVVSCPSITLTGRAGEVASQGPATRDGVDPPPLLRCFSFHSYCRLVARISRPLSPPLSLASKGDPSVPSTMQDDRSCFSLDLGGVSSGVRRGKAHLSSLTGWKSRSRGSGCLLLVE